MRLLDAARVTRRSAQGAALVVAALAGCGSDGTRAPSSADVAIPSPSSARPSGPSAGLRLEFDVAPSDDASLDEALTVARTRLDALAPPGAAVAVYRRDRRVVVELGPMDAEAVGRVRAGLVADGGLAVARCDDASDPLAPLRLVPAPPGVVVSREHLRAGDTGHLEVTYVWAPAEPSASAARERLAAWVAQQAPAAKRVRFSEADEPESRSPRRGVRSYVLAEEPKPLDVTGAEPADPGFGLAAVKASLDEVSAARFAEITAASIQRRVALIVGTEVLSAPVVMERIDGGTLMISLGHGAGAPEARALADRLRLGGGGPALSLAVEETFGATSR